MVRLLAVLILVAPAALAREPFPSDYKPSPCANRAKVCKSFPQSQIAEFGALRGWNIGQEWLDAHWKELMAALEPMCQKLATCMATPGNTHLFCNDLALEEAPLVCERYPEKSADWEKCRATVAVYMLGVDQHSKEPWTSMQSCAKKQAAAQERKIEYWIVPEKFGPGYPGHFTVYAIDAETRVPVQARVEVDSKYPPGTNEMPGGIPTTFYKLPWKPRLTRVPNAQGHRDVVAPQVRIVAPGYATETFRLPMDVPSMVVEMNPPPSKLKPGKNTVTITARDAATGAPVEARVMGGEYVLGKTNIPFELELKKGDKGPEIWVTNLYDRYSDVVVAPAEKK